MGLIPGWGTKIHHVAWSSQIYIYIYIYMGFPGGSAGKESICNAGDLGLIPGLERSPGEGKDYPFSILA